jgi:endonuclease G, mitochondrial
MKKTQKPRSKTSIFLTGILFGVVLCQLIERYPFNSGSLIQKFTPLSTVQEETITSSIMKYGSPQPDYIRYRQGYVLSYDARTKNPYWTYEYVTPRDLEGEAKRGTFKNDPSIPPYHSSTLNDYSGCGYDRGHIAAAGNHKHSQSAMDETFFMSNMSPQVGVGFNRDYWRKLEERIRDIAKRSIGVHVITGPLYLPNEQGNVHYPVIGRNSVAVPTHFFKVILIEKPSAFEQYAILIPNKAIPNDKPLSLFTTTIEKIEHLSGLVFFGELTLKTGYTLDKKRVCQLR